MAALELQLLGRLDDVDDDADRPYHVFAFYEDEVPAPATYAEVIHEGREIPVVVHNFRYYERGMSRWGIGVIEAIVLNELHELTHWAMTEEERLELDERSYQRGRPDGHWLNPVLGDVIAWVGDDFREVVDRDRRSTGARLKDLASEMVGHVRRMFDGERPPEDSGPDGE